MIGPNLSAWSLRRPSLVIFLMIIVVAAGVLAFRKLGRDEDAPFTVRTMIVAAAWPGATVEEIAEVLLAIAPVAGTLSQVTERLERTLQETHKFDTVRSYTTAGQTTIFVDLDETTDTRDIPDVWYRVRRNIGDMRLTLPPGVVGPFFNDLLKTRPLTALDLLVVFALSTLGYAAIRLDWPNAPNADLSIAYNTPMSAAIPAGANCLTVRRQDTSAAVISYAMYVVP